MAILEARSRGGRVGDVLWGFQRRWARASVVEKCWEGVGGAMSGGVLRLRLRMTSPSRGGGGGRGNGKGKGKSKGKSNGNGNGNGKSNSNGKGKGKGKNKQRQRQKQMRGFFTAFRMTAVVGR